MRELIQPPKRPWWGADFLSARDFIRHGALILLAFAVVHYLGLRDYTSVLNGTTGAPDVNPQNAALLGLLYVLFYLAAILVAPIFFIAAALLAGWEKFKAARRVRP